MNGQLLAAGAHLLIVAAIPVLAAGLLLAVGGERVRRLLEVLLPAREDR